MLELFNKAFESKVRLGLMSVLMVNDRMDFNALKDLLKLSDGNLASHATALEKVGYILIEKKFVGKKPNTTYKATATGKKAFQDHLKALEKLLN